MNNGIWAAAKYAGFAVLVAVGATFPGWPVWAALAVVAAGHVWLYRQSMQAIDEYYERADRDAG